MHLSKKICQTIVDNIGTSIVVLNAMDKIVYYNSEASNLVCDKPKKERIDSLYRVILQIRTDLSLGKQEEVADQRIKIGDKEFSITSMSLTDGNESSTYVFLIQEITELLNRQYSEEKLYIDVLNTVFDCTDDWYIVVDKNGIITRLSKAYMKFLGDENAVGKHVTEVVDNTRMHIVVKTGEEEIGDIQRIKGNKMIAMRIPIKENGEIIGAVGKVMFKDIADFYDLSKKINALEKQVQIYKNELVHDKKFDITFSSILGRNKKLQNSILLARKAANSDSSILLTGESGTGKELFVNAIHNASKRYLGPLIKINCSAIPKDLIESELFGYEQGAFTGASKRGKLGKFELANGGTLFLDEIGDMPLDMQVKLLRVIQEKEIYPLGSQKSKKIDVRIISATNKKLDKLMLEKEFREDLYYRLNVFTIHLPSLRERVEDIVEIAESIRQRISSHLGIYTGGFAEEVIECLKCYHWPGNIRELENVIERAILLLDDEILIKPRHLPRQIGRTTPQALPILPDQSLPEVIEKMEREIISSKLEEFNGNKNKVAKILGISRAGLYKKLARYKIKTVNNLYMST